MNQETVKELFVYKNGALWWKPRPREAFQSNQAFVMWNKRYANRKAGCSNNRKYVRIAIYKKLYFAHRLIWLYHFGYIPETIDHINGNPSDNRIKNLRAASMTENRWNSRRLEPTSTNIKGVYKRPNGKYEAHISKDYKRYYLGRFVRKRDAERAVREARKALHHTFARHR